MTEELKSQPSESEKPGTKEARKLKFLESLKYPKGRKEFYRYILEELKKRRNYIKNGFGFLVPHQLKGWINDMKITADEVREKWPQVASTIDTARKKAEKLLEETKKKQ